MEEKIQKFHKNILSNVITVHGSTYVLIPKKIAELYRINRSSKIKIFLENSNFLIEPSEVDKP